MSPFTATAEMLDEAPTMSKALGLRLDPISAIVRVPAPVLHNYADRPERFRVLVDLSRQLLRATRKTASLAIYKAVAGSEAPPDFDWEQMDRDDLADTLAKNAQLNKRIEQKDVALRNYRMFMEAQGFNWRVIERNGAA